LNRNAAFAAGALIGAAAALVYRRRGATVPAVDPRAAELRQKLAQARTSRADEDDFEAAGQGAETVAVEEPPKPPTPPAPPRGPNAEFEEMRRRIHEEGRAAAEEMRREEP
jgi:NAD(P)-dependent dehydrogenase (short-subunit alcohol dehydrogenase family)